MLLPKPIIIYFRKKHKSIQGALPVDYGRLSDEQKLVKLYDVLNK